MARKSKEMDRDIQKAIEGLLIPIMKLNQLYGILEEGWKAGLRGEKLRDQAIVWLGFNK